MTYVTRNFKFTSTAWTLVVDASGIPKDIISWKVAINNILSGAAMLVDPYVEVDGKPVYVHSPSTRMLKPAVIALTSFHSASYGLRVSCSKKHILLRDNFVCQYTGKALDEHEANIDHVVPKSRGGKWTWNNLVTCDVHLNTRKEDKTLDEAGLVLKKKPSKPSRETILVQKIKYSENEVWKDYLKRKGLVKS